MWHLKQPTSGQLNDYCNLLIDKIITRLDAVPLPNVSDKFKATDGTWDKNLLEEILTIQPEKMEQTNTELMTSFIPTYNAHEWGVFIKSRGKKDDERTPVEVRLNLKYADLYKALYKLFDYQGIISHNRNISYEIAKIIGRNTCTYCNRQYTITVVVKKENGNEELITRPNFDHWLSHERYPLLSLSFFNLIPCCTICNSGIKGTKEFSLDTHVHPYAISHKECDFNFCIHNKKEDSWQIKIENKSKLDPKTRRMIKELKIEEIYSYHNDLEVKDIHDFQMSYTETYLESIFDGVLQTFPRKTPAQVYKMLFGAELVREHFLDRPLSKLKYDLLKSVGLIEYIAKK